MMLYSCTHMATVGVRGLTHTHTHYSVIELSMWMLVISTAL